MLTRSFLTLVTTTLVSSVVWANGPEKEEADGTARPARGAAAAAPAGGMASKVVMEEDTPEQNVDDLLRRYQRLFSPTAEEGPEVGCAYQERLTDWVVGLVVNPCDVHLTAQEREEVKGQADAGWRTLFEDGVLREALTDVFSDEGLTAEASHRDAHLLAFDHLVRKMTAVSLDLETMCREIKGCKGEDPDRPDGAGATWSDYQSAAIPADPGVTGAGILKFVLEQLKSNSDSLDLPADFPTKAEETIARLQPFFAAEIG